MKWKQQSEEHEWAFLCIIISGSFLLLYWAKYAFILLNLEGVFEGLLSDVPKIIVITTANVLVIDYSQI